MLPTIISIPIPGIGDIPIYSFGFFMLLCFLSAMKLLEKGLKENGFDTSLAETMVTVAAIGGLLGARLLSAVSNWDHFIQDPIGVLVSGSGFIFYGGLIGGALSVCVFLKLKKYSLMSMADLVAAPLALGYAVGRVGCQISGDGDYGKPTDLFWAMDYKYGVIPTTLQVHPAPVYESLLSLLVVYILLHPTVREKFHYAGQIFGLYLILMSIERFIIEIVRIEPIVLMMFTQAQIIAFAASMLGVLMCMYAKRIQKTA